MVPRRIKIVLIGVAVEDLRAVESGDADGDGVSNGEEITQGTDPATAP